MEDLTRSEREDRIKELTELREQLNVEAANRRFEEEERERFNAYSEEIEEHEETLRELDRREAVIAVAEQNGHGEDVKFQIKKPGVTRGDDIWDIGTLPNQIADPDKFRSEVRDRALRAVEESRFPGHERNKEDVQSHLEDLLDDGERRRGDLVGMHYLLTGSPEYKRAFTKYLSGAPRSQREEEVLYRAMSLTAASGGYAVPFVLDPTVIPTGAGAVNPYRAISNVQQINVDEWRGVTSDGITAAFGAEAAAATDSSPTLAQATVSTEKAFAFIPYSIEIGQDWGSFASEMGAMLRDSKDVLEATKFAVGSGTNEPFGVVTGASSSVYTASNTNSLVVADLYGWEGAIGARWRSRSSVVMNNAVLQKIRQLDTAGGSAMLTSNLQLRSSANASTMTDARANVDLFGHPVYEASGQSGTFTTGQLIGVLGDFSYYKIVDRIGLTIENIPHIFGAAQGNLPTGQRGLYAYWRVGAKVISANAFKVLKLA